MRFQLSMLGLLLWMSLVGLPGNALATSASYPGEFTLELANQDFTREGLQPEFGVVRIFSFSIALAGPLEPGRVYGNGDILDVEYLVQGSLSLNPPTPSGFPGFFLSRTPSREGTISPEDWAAQSSRLAFKISQDAHFLDGIQLSELVPLTNEGTLLKIDAREFKRLDVARYHPPQLLLYADGTGILRNSNNSSGNTGTLNPATGKTVDVDFGEEYITKLRFDPSAITIIAPPAIPEPGTAVLLGLGLAGLSVARRGEGRRVRC